MNALKWAWLVTVMITVSASTLRADLGRPSGGSRIDSDPDVVYVEEFTDATIELLAIKAGGVYATKKGQRKLGNLKIDSKVKLIGFTEKAYKIRGEATHGGISGWVSPKVLASKDQDFVENLQRVYKRQMEVRELVAAGEVAIGMSLDEVAASLGEPTKTKVRQTSSGVSSRMLNMPLCTTKSYRSSGFSARTSRRWNVPSGNRLRQASTKPRKRASRWGRSMRSGCHWTPSSKRPASPSRASITPSSARATTRRPRPGWDTAW